MISKLGSRIIFPQWFAGIGVLGLVIQIGLLCGWTSPALSLLTGPDSPIPLNAKQASWVASLVNLSRFFGAILGPIGASLLGSKRFIFVTLFPLSLCWALIYFSNAVEWLYAARLSGGLGVGIACSIFPLYLGEVSMPEIRGALVSLASVGAPFGQVLASICGSYLPMSVASSMYLASCLLLMFIFAWLPESPHHLVKGGRREAARASIAWYRAGRGVDEELRAVEEFVAANGSKSVSDKLRVFGTYPVRRATFQIIALFTFMQITGLNSVLFYMESILVRAKFTLFSPSLAVIYVNMCGIGASALSVFLIDRCGRKFLLLVSSAGVMTSMLSLMTYFLIMDSGQDLDSLQWIPAAAMFLFVTSFCVGLLSVPSTVLGESFPADVKCIAACIAGVTGASVAFLSSKTYQPMVDLWGEAYVFMIYAVCTATVIPYTLFVMPETKGKSLQQIQDKLTRK